MEDSTTILFGLPDVAVERVERGVDGARTVHVVTDDEDAAACPVCGVFSTSVRQYRTTRPKDLPYGEAPLALRWHKVQWRCREAACPRTAFTESIAELPSGARVTGRTRRAAGAAVGSGRSVSSVAEEYPISWAVVHDAFVAHAEELLPEPAPPAVLGIDETRRGRPRWSRDLATGRWVRSEPFETNFVDLAGEGGLLGQTAGRTVAAVTGWLEARGEEWKASVQVVAMDPCATYRRAISDALPQARIVADHFHLVRLANQTVTAVRQRVTRQTLGRRGRRTTRRGPAAAGCSAAGNGSPSRRSPRCGTTLSTPSRPDNCSAPGSRKRNCGPCCPPPAAAGSGTTSRTGCSGSTTGAPASTSPR
jgi:transposase